MGWETYDETRTCGSLGVPRTSRNVAEIPVIGTVTIPANTVWEVIHMQGRESLASGDAWTAFLRDADDTSIIYARICGLSGAQVTKGNDASPLASTIGPFTEDKTLQAVCATLVTAEPGAVTCTALFRLLQSYD